MRNLNKEVTYQFEDWSLAVFVYNLNIACLVQLEADVVVIADILQTWGLLRQLIVTLYVVFAYPCAVQRQFEDILLTGFQVFQRERIGLRLNCIGIPCLARSTGIGYQRRVTCDIEFSRNDWFSMLRPSTVTLASRTAGSYRKPVIVIRWSGQIYRLTPFIRIPSRSCRCTIKTGKDQLVITRRNSSNIGIVLFGNGRHELRPSVLSVIGTLKIVDCILRRPTSPVRTQRQIIRLCR